MVPVRDESLPADGHRLLLNAPALQVATVFSRGHRFAGAHAGRAQCGGASVEQAATTDAGLSYTGRAGYCAGCVDRFNRQPFPDSPGQGKLMRSGLSLAAPAAVRLASCVLGLFQIRWNK